MNSFYGPECIKFITGICQNCIKLSIDDYSFLYLASEYSVLQKERGINWRAVPFPSDLHWHSKMETPYPWESQHDRDILVSFIGSNYSFNKGTEKLRKAIVIQCAKHTEHCLWFQYGGGSSGLPMINRDFSNVNMVNGTSIHDIMKRSVFCLTPPGFIIIFKLSLVQFINYVFFNTVLIRRSPNKKRSIRFFIARVYTCYV